MMQIFMRARFPTDFAEIFCRDPLRQSVAAPTGKRGGDVREMQDRRSS
jgi:hypothetical protein